MYERVGGSDREEEGRREGKKDDVRGEVENT